MGREVSSRSVELSFFVFALICGFVEVAFLVLSENTEPQYHLFVTQYNFILVFFALLPALFFGFGSLALAEKKKGGRGLSLWVGHFVLFLMVLSFLLLLSLPWSEPDMVGRNGVGGGWTLYESLSTSGKPGKLSYLDGYWNFEAELLALLVVLLSVLVAGLNYIYVLLFVVGHVPIVYLPLGWSVALAYMGAFLLMPYHGFILFLEVSIQGKTGDPVLIKNLLSIFEAGYIALFFIIALGLASAISLSCYKQPKILVKGMTLLILLYAGLEIFSLGWLAFCSQGLWQCQEILPYAGWIVSGKILSVCLLFLLWVWAGMKSRSLLQLPNLWLFSAIFFYLAGALPLITLFVGQILGVSNLGYDGIMMMRLDTLGSVSVPFILFAGLYSFYPVLTKSSLAKGLAFLHLLFVFAGVVLAYIVRKPLPMPRYVSDYASVFKQWEYMTLMAGYVIAFGLLCFVAVLGVTLWEGERQKAR